MIGKIVKVIIGRPLGSRHPRHDIVYPINYGYGEGNIATDGLNFSEKEIREQVDFQEQFFNYSIAL